MPGNAEQLVQAARAKHTDALQRVQQALRRLDRGGQPITFSSVAQAASVHRSWLYRQAEVRSHIERLRAGHTPPPTARCPPLNGPAPNPCGNESKRSAKKPHGSASTTRPSKTS